VRERCWSNWARRPVSIPVVGARPVGAQPVGGVHKKGADRGIDGMISFSTGPHGEVGSCPRERQSGAVNSGMVRDLKGVLDREKAEIGLFVTLESRLGRCNLEATTAGAYHSALFGPRLPAHPDSCGPRAAGRTPPARPCPYWSFPRISRPKRIGKKAAEQGELFGLVARSRQGGDGHDEQLGSGRAAAESVPTRLEVDGPNQRPAAAARVRRATASPRPV